MELVENTQYGAGGRSALDQQLVSLSEGHRMTEAEIVAMPLQAKENQGLHQLPEARSTGQSLQKATALGGALFCTAELGTLLSATLSAATC